MTPRRRAQAVEIDDLAATASAKLGTWEPLGGPSGGVEEYQSTGCSTDAGPLADAGKVLLRAGRLYDGRWTAAAHLVDRPLRNGLLRCVFVEPPEKAGGPYWPDHLTAIAALEAVLRGGLGLSSALAGDRWVVVDLSAAAQSPTDDSDSGVI